MNLRSAWVSAPPYASAAKARVNGRGARRQPPQSTPPSNGMAQPGQEAPSSMKLRSHPLQKLTPSATKPLHPAQRAGHRIGKMRSRSTQDSRSPLWKSCVPGEHEGKALALSERFPTCFTTEAQTAQRFRRKKGSGSGIRTSSFPVSSPSVLSVVNNHSAWRGALRRGTLAPV